MGKGGVGNRGSVGGEDRGKCDLLGVGRREDKNNPGGANSDLPAPVGLNARLINSYELCPLPSFFGKAWASKLSQI